MKIRFTTPLVLMALFLIVLPVASAYEFQTMPSDPTLLNQTTNCVLPCWNGLTPGLTTLEQAQAMIATIPYISLAPEYDEYYGEDVVSIAWGIGSLSHANSLYFENNLLTRIIIDPNIEFDLEDIIGIYGIPPVYEINYAQGIEPLETTLSITLYYPSDGLVLEFLVYKGLPASPEISYPLLATSSGRTFKLYKSADTIEDFLDNIFGHPVSTDGLLTEWPGLGTMLPVPKPTPLIIEFVVDPTPVFTETPITPTFTAPGTVITSIPANVAQDVAGNGNLASTSTDNEVTYDPTPTPEAPISDDSLFNQTECQFPCWNGLTPGLTTLEQAQQSIASIPFINLGSDYHEYYSEEGVSITWETARNSSLWFEDNILERIIISPNIEFNLEDILGIYGIPTAYRINHSTGVEVIGTTMTITLYYPSHGLVIDFLVYSGLSAVPEVSYPFLATSPGDWFTLYESADTLENFMINIYGIPVSTADLLTNWPGIGNMVPVPRPTVMVVEPVLNPTTVITETPTTPTFTASGTANIPANVAQDAAGNGNLASTSTDNEVSYESTTSPMTSVFDDDILDQTACNFPCWHGLTPGITTQAETENFLTADAFVAQAPTVFSRTVGDELQHIWVYRRNDSILDSKLAVKNGILHAIYIEPAIDFTLEQIIDIYGEPAGFTYSYAIQRNVARFIITIYYPGEGLILNFVLYEGPPQINYFLLGSAQGIDFIVLPAQDSFADLYGYYRGYDAATAERQVNAFYSWGWPGFNSRIGEPVAAYLGASVLIPFIDSPTPAPTINESHP